ncbi:uncharacterized protein Dvir_GJ26926 [Drosophila virilis]|uniref:Uncharacterized protein n=1 Tax=Drosophila virilis TaxID=7244 RepID=A0A0Q9WHF6_DROVI|nr:uncharacterized protein Dvir_GJ26926 [Drosophila virilis]
MEQIKRTMVWVGIWEEPRVEKVSIWSWPKTIVTKVFKAVWNNVLDQNKYEMSIGLLAIMASGLCVYLAIKIKQIRSRGL